MKKLLLLAAFGVAGLLSAKSDSGAGISSNKFETQVELLGGWCEIRVYDGNGVLIKYSYTYESSESACYSKANKMLMELETAP